MALAPTPPGIDAARLREAQRAFESALGAGKVFFEAVDRDSYKDKFAVNDAAHHPAGAIAPTSVEEVQAALKVANQYRIPVWPISRGKNLGYGGTAPLMAGSVVMDLSGMKKIEFDAELGTVIIEAGVGFYDLYDYIQANKLPFWLSTPGNSWGSVMGNALDRGVGYTPYGEHTKNICGLEVVLPTGEVVRTGMGAFSNAPTWQAYPFGFGPGWDQMFVQSNFGVVTKMGMWLMPEPESLVGMDVEFDRPEDLKAMVDVIGPLRRERVLQQSPSIGNWLRAARALSASSRPVCVRPAAVRASYLKAGMRGFDEGSGLVPSLLGEPLVGRAQGIGQQELGPDEEKGQGGRGAQSLGRCLVYGVEREDALHSDEQQEAESRSDGGRDPCDRVAKDRHLMRPSASQASPVAALLSMSG